MNGENYIQIKINVASEQLSDIIIAELSQLNYEGFEQEDGMVKAFIKEKNFRENDLAFLSAKYAFTYVKTTIKTENWNALWEKNFEPVAIGDFCLIRAHFHPPSAHNFRYEIIITPKMSFGTGHHATTYMMGEQMRSLDFVDKTVADFGTGTGILAILSEKLGSKYVWAIDNDDWSIQNARENFEMNDCRHVELFKADAFATSRRFDIILANINKNVILENLDGLVKGLQNNGKLVVSGILKQDEHDVLSACQNHSLLHVKTLEKNNWISLLLQKLTA